jgi:hypothetical protein
VTSTRKLEANRRNAARSTGPRTPGGKLRSRQNARRHGLATPVENDSEVKASIERVGAILAEGGDDFLHFEKMRTIAECHFDLRRIRAARYDVFLRLGDVENASRKDLETASRAMDSISRYERRAISKRKQAQRNSND